MTLHKLFSVNMNPAVNEDLKLTLESGYVSQGLKVEEFEHELKNVFSNPYVLTVNSGTSALTLALRLAGVGPGDEVISTPMTCSATNMAIMASGAQIVWADVSPYTGNIDPKSIAAEVTKKTKAIMTVDWGGLPCDYNEIRAAAPGIKIIEDAAHAIGSTYNSIKIANVADFTCFSFQAIKHLTTVDGGAVACLDQDAYLRGKKLRWFGIDRDSGGTMRHTQDIEEWGYKFHMNDVNATVGLANLRLLPRVLCRHKEIAKYYAEALANTAACTVVEKDRTSSWWLYTILLPNKFAVEKFQSDMADKNIETGKVHQRNDMMSCFKDARLYKATGVDSFYERMICIPINAHLTDLDVEYIAKSAKKAI